MATYLACLCRQGLTAEYEVEWEAAKQEHGDLLNRSVVCGQSRDGSRASLSTPCGSWDLNELFHLFKQKQVLNLKAVSSW